MPFKTIFFLQNNRYLIVGKVSFVYAFKNGLFARTRDCPNSSIIVVVQDKEGSVSPLQEEEQGATGERAGGAGHH